MHLNISEIFGPTIQGEGRHAGQTASFLRLSGCNLSCSWCDTPYTWDWDRFDRSQEVTRMGGDEVVQKLAELPGRVVVSGGEPLVQARGLAPVLAVLKERGRVLDVETNGTRALGDTAPYWDTVTCSPKIIPSAGHETEKRALSLGIHPSVKEVADFKFVIHDARDLTAVNNLVRREELPPWRVWLMPEGTSAGSLTERTPAVMSAARDHGYNFTSRLHVYGWGDRRGV